MAKLNTAGNRANLRSEWYNQIKKTDSVTSILGPLSNVLVTTWGGLFMGMGSLGLGIFAIVKLVTANGTHTLIANIPAILLVLIGTILITLNVVLTNPAMGSQIKVSLRFLAFKLANYSKRGKYQSLRDLYRISKDDANVIETSASGRRKYMAVYQVRGIVSPVTFDNELERMERVNGDMLSNLGRDTQIDKIVTIQKARVLMPVLPKNATPGMRELAQRQYNLARSIPDNQQLTSHIIIVAPSIKTLYDRLNFVETAFRNGLVISYSRLSGEQSKKEIHKIYG
jgi:hypothetical protein